MGDAIPGGRLVTSCWPFGTRGTCCPSNTELGWLLVWWDEMEEEEVFHCIAKVCLNNPCFTVVLRMERPGAKSYLLLTKSDGGKRKRWEFCRDIPVYGWELTDDLRSAIQGSV